MQVNIIYNPDIIAPNIAYCICNQNWFHRVDERIPWIFALPVVVYKCVHILRHSEMSCNCDPMNHLRYSISLIHFTVRAHFYTFFLNWFSILILYLIGRNTERDSGSRYWNLWSILRTISADETITFFAHLKNESHIDSVLTDEVNSCC